VLAAVQRIAGDLDMPLGSLLVKKWLVE
jgi:hypothetical protein